MSLNVAGLRKTFRDPLTLKKRQVLLPMSAFRCRKVRDRILEQEQYRQNDHHEVPSRTLNYEQRQISFFDSQYDDFRKHISYMPKAPVFYEYLADSNF